MANIIKLGSLRLNGQPKGLDAKYNGEIFSFGDTDPTRAIPFVQWGKLLVATQVICLGISWEDLNKLGFIFGRPIKVDGADYLCRSFKVGSRIKIQAEWDTVLDDLGEDNSFWYREDVLFWGQETPKSGPGTRMVRGSSGPSDRYWHNMDASRRSVFVGFRPVLEPLSPEPLLSDSLAGVKLKLFGPDMALVGQLTRLTDYDLIIKPSPKQRIPASCKWARRTGNHIIIDRSAAVWAEEDW